jgi:opacity protein-like surface antigen
MPMMIIIRRSMRPFLSMPIAAAAMAFPAAAQRGIAVEVRGGAGVGNHAPAASDLGFAPGPAFGATVSYVAARRVEVYAGYSRTGFGCEDGFCAGRGTTFTSQGMDVGVRVSLPAAASPWVRAGLIRHRLDASPALDDPEPWSGEVASGVGMELGAGAELRLGPRLAMTPGIRYVRYGGGDDGVAMLVGDVGLRLRW